MPTVAYLGPEKTNTYFAARKKFGASAKYVHAPTVEDIFQSVERRKADFGVVPIENSLEGAVTHTLDRFMDFQDSPAKICAEVDLSIQHYLITSPGASLGRIKTVFSHPQALGQCRQWLNRQCPGARRVETSSTAEAVGRLVENEGHPRAFEAFKQEAAAIGRQELAKELRLKAIPIPTDQENRTRFLVLSLQASKKGKGNKTSLVFALKDKPGALHDALVPFKNYGINLMKIESRPTKRKAWEYVFFVDFAGHQSDPKVRKALKALRRCTAEVRVLGSYPVGSKS